MERSTLISKILFLLVASYNIGCSNWKEDDFICRINAFDLVNQKCCEESLHTDSIFERHEVLHSIRPDLFNLSDGNFCLILQSKRTKRIKKSMRLLYARYIYIYIYCVVLKVEEEEDNVYKRVESFHSISP